jgi:hypothetical protein
MYDVQQDENKPDERVSGCAYFAAVALVFFAASMVIGYNIDFLTANLNLFHFFMLPFFLVIAALIVLWRGKTYEDWRGVAAGVGFLAIFWIVLWAMVGGA